MLRSEVPVSVSITGTQSTIERIESLGAALELPGLPVHRFGSTFMTRHHHQHNAAKQQRRATRAKLSYALVPKVYQVVYAYDGFDAAQEARTGDRAWLAARVAGLPQRDTSGSIMIF